MRFRRTNAALLILSLLAPSVPVYSDCGCGDQPDISESSPAAHHAAGSCCIAKAPKAACCAEDDQASNCCEIQNDISCCGNSGDACKCSSTAGGCQCGDDCRCGQAEEPPVKQPAAPTPNTESSNAVAEILLANTLVAPTEDLGSLLSPRTEVDAALADSLSLTSPERCCQLCRFLR